MKKKILAGILATAMLAGISTNVMASSVSGSAGGATMYGSNIIDIRQAGAYTTASDYADNIRVSLDYCVSGTVLKASNSNTGTRIDVVRNNDISGRSEWVQSRHGMVYKGHPAEGLTAKEYL